MSHSHRDQHARPRGWLLTRIGLGIALALAVTFGVVRSHATEAAPGPRLEVSAPASVAVGQPIDVSVVVKNANGIAGYQVTAQFDTSVAHLSGLKQRQNDLKKLGRSVETLGPIEQPDGVTFGAYSCPFNSCVNTSGNAKNSNGGKGTVKLGTFSVVADQAGTFVIQLSSMKFTDPAGNPLSVDASASTITVQVQ